MPETLIDRRFELKDQLGRSDVGELFLATDAVSGEMLALKRFGERIDPHGEDWQRYARAVRRTAAMHHPHLLLPTEAGVFGARGYQVTPYFPAESLDQAIRGGALALAGQVEVLRQLAQGLAALHGAGLQHGNLRPSNVLISRDEQSVHAVSCDPYLNLLRGPENAVLHEALAPWHAPEAAPWLERTPDARADLYTLGTLAYWMLTGRLPFPEGTPAWWMQRRLAALPPPPREWNVHLPERLSAIVMRLLARDPDERWPSAQALLNALERWDAAEPESENATVVFLAPVPGVRRVPLSGREGAREAILAALSGAKSGQGSLALLTGEAGSGRATVLDSLRFTFEAAGALTLRVRLPRQGWCAPFEAPVELFRQLLHRWVFLPDARRRDLLYGLHQRIGEHAALWTGLLPESATLLPDAPPPPPMPPDRQRLRMLTVLGDTFAALAARDAPLVIELVGLERIDADSLDWLRFLFHRIGERPLVVLATVTSSATAEEGSLADWLRAEERSPALLRVPIPPLTQAQTAQAVAAELGQPSGTPDSLPGRIAQAMQPLWRGLALAQALQLERWRQVGWLAWSGESGEGGWSWDEEARNRTPQTETFGALADAWLAALPEPLYTVLEPASVLPGAFTLDELSALLQDIPPEVLVDRLESLCERGALARAAHAYRVSHERLREAVYRRVSSARKQGWHQAAGAQEEAGVGSAQGPGVPLVGATRAVRHFEAAEENARAIESSLSAAEEARRHHTLHAACRELEALIATLGDDPRAGPLFAALGEARLRLGEPALAVPPLNEALRRASTAEQRADTLGMLARVELAQGQRDEALARLEEALRLLGESLPARPVGTALARLAAGAAARYHQILSQASGAAEPPLNPADERVARLLELASLALGARQPARAALADERILGLSAGRLPSPLTVRALVRLGAGDPRGAALDQAAALAETHHFPHEAAQVRLARAQAAWEALDTARLNEELMEIGRAFHALGDPLGEAEALLLRVSWAAWQGPAVAIADATRRLHGLAMLCRSEALRTSANAWMRFAAAMEGHERPSDAIRALARIAEPIAGRGDSAAQAEPWRLSAELSLFAGQPQGAAAAAEQALRLADGAGASELRALLCEALLETAQNALDAGGDGGTPLREARRLLRVLSAESRDLPRLSVRALCCEVMDDLLNGDPARAIAHAEERLTYLETAGLRFPAAWLAFRVAQGLKSAGHADWLAWGGRALTGFDALGAELPRRTTRRLLELEDAPEAELEARPLVATPSEPWPEGLATLLDGLASGGPEAAAALPGGLLRWLAGETGAARAALFLADADGAPALAITVPGGEPDTGWINRWLVERTWHDATAQRLEHYQPPGENAGSALSVLCLPLLRDGIVRGAAYLTSTVARHVFGPHEQARGLALAGQAGTLLALAGRLDALHGESNHAAREAQVARERAEWALAVSTLDGAATMIEAFLRDVAAPHGYTSAAAFRWNRAAQRLEPVDVVSLGRSPLGAVQSVPLAESAAQRVREVLDGQQPAAFRAAPGPTPEWEQASLEAIHGWRGLWLPLVSRGASEGALLLGGGEAGPPGAGAPGAEAGRDMLSWLRTIAPTLIHAWERDHLARLGGSLGEREAALERLLADARAFVPESLQSRWAMAGNPSGAESPALVTAEQTIAIAGNIWGWEGLAATSPPPALATSREYFALVEEALALHHARLDYARDGAWLARGERGTDSALWAAQAVIALLRRWQAESERPWARRLRTGIGIHSGTWSDAIAQLERRREAFPLGEGPSTARELARLNFRFHTDVLISETAREGLANPAVFELRPLGSQRFAAGTRRARFHEYYGTKERGTRERMAAGGAVWEDALRYFREGTWGKAEAKLKVYLAALPEDRPARLFLRACRDRMR